MNRLHACFIHSETIEQYHYPADCPFKTERAARTRAILRSTGCYEGNNRREIAPQKAQLEELYTFHTPAYIDALRDASAGKIDVRLLSMGIGSQETPLFHDLFEYGMLASGATLTGVRMILEGAADIAFNPSGGYHHAHAAEAGGFCYINDIVLGAKALAAAGKRVLCLDLDAHHGNGTQNAFYDTDTVFTVSMHESGTTLYPWGGFEQEIGEKEGKGYNVNLPVPAGTDDDIYVAAFREAVWPLLNAYNPDVILLEIGMDILAVDPLTHLNMTNNVIADLIPQITSLHKPLMVTGGGGYDPESAARGWALAWCSLCGIDFETDRYIGMGGVFLGSSEWTGGLRDMRSYSSGDQRNEIVAKTAATVDYIRHNVFPIHGL